MSHQDDELMQMLANTFSNVNLAKEIKKNILHELRMMRNQSDKKAIELQLKEFRLNELIDEETFQSYMLFVDQFYQLVLQRKMLEVEIVKIKSHQGQLDVEMIRMLSKKEQEIDQEP